VTTTSTPPSRLRRPRRRDTEAPGAQAGAPRDPPGDRPPPQGGRAQEARGPHRAASAAAHDRGAAHRPSSTADDGRARKLAVGGLSLLILALASATLLAFTARDERRRVAR
jgi:hypothetical protein